MYDSHLYSPTEVEAHVAFHLSKMLSAGELLRMGDKWPQLHQEIRRAATELAYICRGAFSTIDFLQIDAEAGNRDAEIKERYIRELSKELRELREEREKPKVGTQPRSSCARSRTVGVQTTLLPMEEKRSVGV